jgi:hypothetical protein
MSQQKRKTLKRKTSRKQVLKQSGGCGCSGGSSTSVDAANTATSFPSSVVMRPQPDLLQDPSRPIMAGGARNKRTNKRKTRQTKKRVVKGGSSLIQPQLSVMQNYHFLKPSYVTQSIYK